MKILFVFSYYRSEENRCVFLRCEVYMYGATFHAVLTDADKMPPPFRIDNFSKVKLSIWVVRTVIRKSLNRINL